MSEKTKEVSKEILMILGTIGIAAGVLGLCVVCPGGMKELMKLINEYQREKNGKSDFDSKQIKNTINYLQRKKLIRKIYLPDGLVRLEFSNWGERQARLIKLEKFGISKPEKWDGRWRVVIFDVPEKYKLGREGLRKMFVQMGFYRLQHSVYVFPYACEEEIEFLRSVYEVKPFVKLILATDLEGVNKVKEYFEL